MSSRSGITASPEVIDSFNKASSSVLVVTILEDSTQLVHDSSFNAPSQSKTNDVLIALKSHFSDTFPQPKYAIFTHSDSGERVFISFVPDEAPVRLKMLFAATKNTFLQQLGSVIPKNHILSLTEISDLDSDAFNASIKQSDHSVSMTAKEKSLEVMNSLQHLSMGQKNELPSMGTKSHSSNLFFKIDPKLDSTLKSNLASKLVVMSIDTETEILKLHADQDGVATKDLISVAQSLVSGELSPAYLLFGYSEGHVAFIYSCASGCKVKARMLYAANKQGLLTHLKNDYFTEGQLDQTFEVGDLDELELSALEESELDKKVTKTSELKFSKPKGPRRR